MPSSDLEDDRSGDHPTGANAVLVGDEANAVSAQVFQSIYNEITGKSETVGKNYDKPFEITYSDIEHLNHQIKQAHEQYNVCTSNCAITIYYLNNSRDNFSSFERFSMHNAGATSPVESILIKYNLLIILPKVAKPQTYSISVRLISRVAMERRMSQEIHPFPSFYRFLGGGSSARVEIEYVDYLVARNFLGLIDDWFGVLPFAKAQKTLLFLQRRSHWIPTGSRFLTAVAATFLAIEVYPTFVSADHGDLAIFGKFALFAGLGIYVAYTLAGWTGRYVEHALDRWSEVSFLRLNKGDEAEIRKSIQENRLTLVKAVVGIISTLSVSVITKIIASLIISSFGGK